MTINSTYAQSRHDLIIKFTDVFGEYPSASKILEFFCPGRVNLIGEHTDYTGGLVFPCAINLGTHLVVARTNNKQFRFSSTNVSEPGHFDTEDLFTKGKSGWYRYPIGVIDQFNLLGFDIDGLDLLYSGNIPNGAGLSSSASIEVVTAIAINELFNCKLSKLDIIQLCQRAENDFVGTKSGVMDQFAVTAGVENHALLLDCHTLEFQPSPLNLGVYRLLIADTQQKHDNSAEDGYNSRVRECNEALSLLKQRLDISHLGALTESKLADHHDVFENKPILKKRVNHIVSENTRVRAAAKAMKENQVPLFGKLMLQSHESLNSDYEVSSDALNLMVKLAMEQPGVIGSRLTGAGFGGCTVNLVAEHKIDEAINNIGAAYQSATSLEPKFYTVVPSAGAHKVSK